MRGETTPRRDRQVGAVRVRGRRQGNGGWPGLWCTSRPASQREAAWPGTLPGEAESTRERGWHGSQRAGTPRTGRHRGKAGTRRHSAGRAATNDVATSASTSAWGSSGGGAGCFGVGYGPRRGRRGWSPASPEPRHLYHRLHHQHCHRIAVVPLLTKNPRRVSRHMVGKAVAGVVQVLRVAAGGTGRATLVSRRRRLRCLRCSRPAWATGASHSFLPPVVWGFEQPVQMGLFGLTMRVAIAADRSARRLMNSPRRIVHLRSAHSEDFTTR